MRIRPAAAGECWLWTGQLNSRGYGRTTIDGERVLAHRVSYKLFVGPIRAGMTIDHICDTPACVNPAHLEQKSLRANSLRSETSPTAINKRKTHCDHGHAFTFENTYWAPRGYRQCRKCKARRERERRKHVTAPSAPSPPA